MEREVSTSVTIGIAMCSLAVLNGRVLLTVRIGNEVKGDAYNKASEMQTKSENSTLRDLRGADKEMSIAAVFGVVKNGYDHIGTIDTTGMSWGNSTDRDDAIKEIQNNLAGRAVVKVDYDNLGYYNIKLLEVN